MYVSEARDAGVLRQLESVVRSTPGAALANRFVDSPYNRTGFTLVGTSTPQLAAAVASLAHAALAVVDLRCHAATHPRLGAVDHISCHPLAAPSAEPEAAAEAAAGPAAAEAAIAGERQVQQRLDPLQGTAVAEAGEAAAAELAREIAQQLGSGPLAVPVFTYGWAHPQQRPLDALRRQLGYFKEAAGGGWQGALQLSPSKHAALDPAAAAAAAASGASAAAAAADALPLAPCYGPAAAPLHSGICCVGAASWVVNYNILLLTDDLAAARAIARAVTQRGGGLAGVQAMALRHSEGIEVATNLLDPAASPPAAVLAAVQRLAAERGLEVGAAYRTNKTPEELVAAALAAGL